ncbi:MFS transporter [Massilia niabensis]|uniref:MFS transporter n=1 Tax=Massilia niabensis TaxID=544910 RepID=A0ABW0L097_9BURK
MKLPVQIALMVLAHTAFTGGRVALTLAALRLGATPFEVGIVVSMLAVLPMLLSVHAGRWTDRSGQGRPLLLALLLLEAALLLALVPTLAGLGAAAVLLGCGFMLVHLAINNAVGNGSAPEERTHGFSMLALGISTSTIAGPVLAGFLVDLAGAANTFLVLAVLPLLALALLRWQRRSAAPAPAQPAPAARARMADLLRHAPLRAVFVASTLLAMGWDLFTFMMPTHGARIGLSASSIGLVMGAFGVGTFVVRMFMPALARAFAPWQVLAGALALTALVYVMLPLFDAVAPLLALAFLLGLGLGSALPMIMTALQEASPPGRSGEAIGVRTMLVNASQTVLPVSFGAIGSAGGTGFVFWALAAVLGCGVVFAARQHR